MTRKQVREFLKAGADALTMHFDAGRLTEFNKIADKGFPFTWVFELKAATEFGGSGATPIDDWSINIRISKADTPDSIQDQYEEIIDDCDLFAQKLVGQYNLILSGSASVSTDNQDLYKLITLSGINRDPFHKQHANPPTSGVDLSFNLNAPDKTDVCP